MPVPPLVCDVKIYNGMSTEALFGDGIYLTTATEMRNSMKGKFSGEDNPSREECASQLTNIDTFFDGMNNAEIKETAQSLIKTMNEYGWGKSTEWRRAKKYLKKLAK